MHSESLFNPMGYLSGECAHTYSETAFQSKYGGTFSVAAHSGILAWEIPWTEEPGGLHQVTKSWT